MADSPYIDETKIYKHVWSYGPVKGWRCTWCDHRFVPGDSMYCTLAGIPRLIACSRPECLSALMVKMQYG